MPVMSAKYMVALNDKGRMLLMKVKFKGQNCTAYLILLERRYRLVYYRCYLYSIVSILFSIISVSLNAGLHKAVAFVLFEEQLL